jgi:hypothetical protein
MKMKNMGNIKGMHMPVLRMGAGLRKDIAVVIRKGSLIESRLMFEEEILYGKRSCLQEENEQKQGICDNTVQGREVLPLLSPVSIGV